VSDRGALRGTFAYSFAAAQEVRDDNAVPMFDEGVNDMSPSIPTTYEWLIQHIQVGEPGFREAVETQDSRSSGWIVFLSWAFEFVDVVVRSASRKADVLVVEGRRLIGVALSHDGMKQGMPE
jgi:hypothetical protein